MSAPALTSGSEGAGGGSTVSGGMSLGSAGVMAGGSLLSGYLQALAQEEAERKKRELEAYQTQMQAVGETGKQQESIMANLMNQYRATLLGG